MRRAAALTALLALLASACGAPAQRAAGPSAPAGSAPAAGGPAVSTPGTAGGGWPTYHRTGYRDGSAPGLPAPGTLRAAWRADLGAVYGEPIVADGLLVVGTERDEVVALDPRTGRVAWRRSVGSPVPRSRLPCGDIDPEGISSTPVYDPATGAVYAVAETGGAAGRIRHVLVSLAVRTGALLWQREVDPAGSDPGAEQQRGALALDRGRVLVVYGGLFGDCGPYHGYAVSAAEGGTGQLLVYRVPSAREAGIWAASGPAVDPAGDVYVSVGNGASRGSYDGSDAVTELSPGLVVRSYFAEGTWVTDNTDDLDLGSSGPLLLRPSARLPGGGAVIAGKSGQVYLLRPGALGGIGHPEAGLSGCRAFGGAAALGDEVFLPCAGGLRALSVGPGPRLAWSWGTQVTDGSPVVGGGAVWAASGATLYALAAGSGAVRARLPVGQVSRFATPTLYGGEAFVPTLSGVVAVSGA